MTATITGGLITWHRQEDPEDLYEQRTLAKRMRGTAAELADDLGSATGKRPWVTPVVVIWAPFEQHAIEDNGVHWTRQSATRPAHQPRHQACARAPRATRPSHQGATQGRESRRCGQPAGAPGLADIGPLAPPADTELPLPLPPQPQQGPTRTSRSAASRLSKPDSTSAPGGNRTRGLRLKDLRPVASSSTTPDSTHSFKAAPTASSRPKSSRSRPLSRRSPTASHPTMPRRPPAHSVAPETRGASCVRSGSAGVRARENAESTARRAIEA